MVTMAERLRNVETDVVWIKETNIKQSQDINEIKNTLNQFINDAPKCYASKKTEEQVERLLNWKYYVMGGFAVIIIVIGIIINYIK